MLNTLKPARAKASRPYAPGMKLQHHRVLTIAGGAKGTGNLIGRTEYDANRLDEPFNATTYREDVVSRVTAAVEKRGYTIAHWPKELRPQ